MDFIPTPVPVVAISVIREGELVSIAFIYDLESAPRESEAALELLMVAAQAALMLDVPLHVDGSENG